MTVCRRWAVMLLLAAVGAGAAGVWSQWNNLAGQPILRGWLLGKKTMTVGPWGEEVRGVRCRISALETPYGQRHRLLLFVENRSRYRQNIIVYIRLTGEFVDLVHLVEYDNGTAVRTDYTPLKEREDSFYVNPGRTAVRELLYSYNIPGSSPPKREIRVRLNMVLSQAGEVAVESGALREEQLSHVSVVLPAELQRVVPDTEVRESAAPEQAK